MPRVPPALVVLYTGVLMPCAQAQPLDVDEHSPSRGTAAACQPCHGETWSTWRKSRHAASFTNPLFQLSLQSARQRDWCLSCHLPRPEQRALLGEVGHRGAAGTLVEDGVDCHTCHIEDGHIVSGTRPDDASLVAHGVEARPHLKTSAFCARCHQFEGPVEHPPFALGGDPLQDTYGEWVASGVQTTCQDCHMPDGEHRFPGAHDRTMLQRALTVDVSSDGATVTLALATTEAVAHKVPTGDPFRRLRVALCADADCQTLLWSHHLGVSHEHRDGVLRVARDTRLEPGGQWRVTLPLPPGAQHWQVALLYGEVQWTPLLPPEEQLGVVYQGVL